MRITRLFALLALPLFADPYVRQPGIDAQHYVFRIELNDASDEIRGEATIDFLFVQPNVTRVALDLAEPMKVVSVSPGTFTRDGDRLVITLPAAPVAGEHRKITVTYQGVPKSGLRIG